MATYVLVHGSWMAAWWWDAAAAALRRAGHAVHAPDLDAAPGTGPMEHAAAVAALLDEHDLRRVVLAGHSSGGLVIAAAADRAAAVAAQERPVRLAGAAAGLPATYVHCLRSDFADQAARARERGFDVVTVDAGHHVALEDPGALAAVLLRAAPANE